MMKRFNVIAVFSPDGQKILMCLRRKDPYKGLYNLVGGKLEPGEDSESAAYRELYEETGITCSDVTLTHLMDMDYYLPGIHLEVYFGQLHAPIQVSGEENELFWIDAKSDFFDSTRFAGEGNIGHMLEQIKQFGDGFLD